MNCPWCDKPVQKTEGFCSHCQREMVRAGQKSVERLSVKRISRSSTPTHRCQKCDAAMLFVGEQELQRSSGFSNLFLGELGDLLKGTLRLDMFACRACGKVEFFLPKDTLQRVRERGELD